MVLKHQFIPLLCLYSHPVPDSTMLCIAFMSDRGKLYCIILNKLTSIYSLVCSILFQYFPIDLELNTVEIILPIIYLFVFYSINCILIIPIVTLNLCYSMCFEINRIPFLLLYQLTINEGNMCVGHGSYVDASCALQVSIYFYHKYL